MRGDLGVPNPRLLPALRVLVSSVLWMPLTFSVLDDPSLTLCLWNRIVLTVVGLGAIGFVAALLGLRPIRFPLMYWRAVAGSMTIAIQTAVLGTLVWPAFFSA